MGIVSRSLRLLFPRGLAWRLPGQVGALVDALALSVDRWRLFARGVVSEALPGTADETLPDWYAGADVPYDASLPLAARQARIAAVYAATGGQSIGYLQDQITPELPDVSIQESTLEDEGSAAIYGLGSYGLMRYGHGNPIHTFQVVGFVDTTDDYNRLLAILARLFPLHLAPIINVTIRSTLGVARYGVGKYGTMRYGNA